jgi:hypothetical protein
LCPRLVRAVPTPVSIETAVQAAPTPILIEAAALATTAAVPAPRTRKSEINAYHRMVGHVNEQYLRTTAKQYTPTRYPTTVYPVYHG